MLDYDNVLNNELREKGGVSLINGDFSFPKISALSLKKASYVDNLMKGGDRKEDIMRNLEMVSDNVQQGILKKHGRKARAKDRLFKRYRDKNITIPKGPSMLIREDNRKMSIRKRKNEEYLREKRRKEEANLKTKFKAKPVPSSITTPMFANIMRGKQEASAKVKHQVQMDSLVNSKPFSFYERDKEKHLKKKEREGPVNEECNINFTAKNLPGFYCKADTMAHEQKLKERNKKALKEKRKKMLKGKVNAPSMMESDLRRRKEKEEKIEKLRKELFEKECKFNPMIKKKVPNFRKIHSDLRDTKKKQQAKVRAKLTVPKGFNITQSKERELLKEPNESQKEEAKLVKKKMFGAINSFLNRNYLPTKEKQKEAQDLSSQKNKKKMEELKKMTENRKAGLGKLMKQVVVLKGFTKKEQPKETTLGIFTVENNQKGDQAMVPGMEVSSKPLLFEAKKKQSSGMMGSMASIGRPKDTEAMRRQELQRKKEQKKKAREQKKSELEQEAKKAKTKLAKKRVREQLIKLESGKQKPASQTLNIKDVFEEQDAEYSQRMGKMKERVSQKPSLLSHKFHSSKMLQYYRRLVEERQEKIVRESAVDESAEL